MRRTKLNLPPESVVYTGSYINTMTAIEVFNYDAAAIKFDVYTDGDFE